MKTIRTVGIALLCVAAGASPLTATAAVSLTAALAPLSSPQAVAHFLSENFTFGEDARLFGEPDHWQTPEEFWARGVGDCEDYALLAQLALGQLGYEAHVVSFYGTDGLGHTVTVFRDGGEYRIVNEDRLEPIRAASLAEALSSLNQGWTWAAIAEQRGTRGWMVREIRNPAYSFLSALEAARYVEQFA